MAVEPASERYATTRRRGCCCGDSVFVGGWTLEAAEAVCVGAERRQLIAEIEAIGHAARAPVVLAGALYLRAGVAAGQGQVAVAAGLLE